MEDSHILVLPFYISLTQSCDISRIYKLILGYNTSTAFLFALGLSRSSCGTRHAKLRRRRRTHGGRAPHIRLWQAPRLF